MYLDDDLAFSFLSASFAALSPDQIMPDSYEASLEYAIEQDCIDPLAALSARFHIPVYGGKKAIYFC